MFDDSNSSSSHRTMIMDEKIDAGSVIDIENLTLDLQNHCRVYRSKLDAWVDDQMVRCHAAVERHNASAALHQSRIDQTMQTLLAWQLQDGLTINNNNNNNNNKSNNKNNPNEKNKQRETLRQKQLLVQDELDGLQVQLDEKTTHLQDLQRQEQDSQARIQKIRAASLQKQSLKRAKIDELSQGISQYYAHLGLEFEKDPTDASVEQLRFSFTQLDPNDPERRFSFHLSTNEQDDFVVHVLTTLDNSNDNSDGGGGEILFEPVIQALKETEDLAAFVRDMRKTFLHQLSSSSSSSTASHSNSPSETRTNE